MFSKSINLFLIIHLISFGLFLNCDKKSKGLNAGGEILLNGLFNAEKFGSSVAFIGDINADGADDVAVGAPENSENGTLSGMLYIFFGPFNNTEVSRTPDLKIRGVTGSGFGNSVVGGFDLNADGISDFAVSSLRSTFGSSSINGDLYIFYGNATIFQKKSEALLCENITGRTIIRGQDSISGSLSPVGFGKLVTKLGDFDRNGIEDLAVSSPDSDYLGKSKVGALFIFLGGKSIIPDSIFDAGLADQIFVGSEAQDRFSYSVDRGLDLDGQGTSSSPFEDDLIVGSPGDGSTPGKASVFLGPSGKFGTGLIRASNSDLTISGNDGDLSFGHSVARLKDIDGDGCDDFAVSAEKSGKTRVYIFYGRYGTPPLDQKSLIIEGSGFSKTGEVSLSSIVWAGVGIPVIGAPLGGGSGFTQGAVFIMQNDFLNKYPKYVETTISPIYGSIILNNSIGLDPSGSFATVLSGDGDINSDANSPAYDDLLIGVPGGIVNGSGSGFAILAF
jgi:hypothetical protein